MKTVTVRLPEELLAQIDAESRDRNVSRSDVVRERLERARDPGRVAPLDRIEDLIGSVTGLPEELSARKKHYLRASGYGRKRPR